MQNLKIGIDSLDRLKKLSTNSLYMGENYMGRTKDLLMEEEEKYWENLHYDYLYEEWQKEQAKEKLSDNSTSQDDVMQ